jgi:hypothetical protein
MWLLHALFSGSDTHTAPAETPVRQSAGSLSRISRSGIGDECVPDAQCTMQAGVLFLYEVGDLHGLPAGNMGLIAAGRGPPADQEPGDLLAHCAISDPCEPAGGRAPIDIM